MTEANIGSVKQFSPAKSPQFLLRALNSETYFSVSPFLHFTSFFKDSICLDYNFIISFCLVLIKSKESVK